MSAGWIHLLHHVTRSYHPRHDDLGVKPSQSNHHLLRLTADLDTATARPRGPTLVRRSVLAVVVAAAIDRGTREQMGLRWRYPYHERAVTTAAAHCEQALGQPRLAAARERGAAGDCLGPPRWPPHCLRTATQRTTTAARVPQKPLDMVNLDRTSGVQEP